MSGLDGNTKLYLPFDENTKAKNETGNRYGRLVVLGRVENDKKGNSRWQCLCDCGNTHIVRGGELRYGSTKSCGCWNKESRMIKYGEASFNSLFSNYKRRAESKNIEFNLTKEQFKNITKQVCHYCGVEPQQERITKKNGSYIYNGIDRKDSNIGYVLDNCLPSCGTCNMMKKDMGYDIFINHIHKIHNTMVGDIYGRT